MPIGDAAAGYQLHRDQDIGIADITAAARVSQRAVEHHFRRAHRELEAAAPGDDLTITTVAYRWSFSSPSPFGAYYRAACSPERPWSFSRV